MVTYVGSNFVVYTDGGNSVSKVLSTPTGTAAGDTMYVVLRLESATAKSLTIPSGWVLKDSLGNGVDSSAYLLYKHAVAGDVGATHTFTWTGGAWSTGAISTYRDGAASGDPFGGDTGWHAFSGSTIPSRTYTSTGAGVVLGFFTAFTDTQTVTAPSGYVKDYSTGYASINYLRRSTAAGSGSISTGAGSWTGTGQAFVFYGTMLDAAAANVAPTADAGADLADLEPWVDFTLDGSASTDPDGTIASVLWEHTAGAGTATIADPTALTTTASIAPDTFAEVAHTFQLTVTDNDGATDTDTATRTVLEPAAAGYLDGGVWKPMNVQALSGGAWQPIRPVPLTAAAGAAPSAPTSVNMTNVTQTTATINWSAPANNGDSALTGYVVAWGGWESAPTATNVFSFDLTGFVADTEYTISVYAENSDGRSPAGTVTFTTAAAAAASSLPDAVVGAYWPTWSGTALTALPTGAGSGYNVIWLAFATPTDNGGDPGAGTGAVTYAHSNFSNAAIKADIATLRANGVSVILSVGGSGNYVYLDTDGRRDAFYNSIKTIYNNIGPFDGLDWNFETNYISPPYQTSVTGAVLTRILWVCSSLVADYPGFAITKPPSPSSTHDRNWVNAMNNQGTFDLVMPQFYDGGGPEFPNSIAFWTDSAGVGTPSKVAAGVIDNERYSQYGSGTGTQASIATRWNTAVSTYPGLRGAMYWHTGIDAQTAGGSQAYWFANTFGQTLRA